MPKYQVLITLNEFREIEASHAEEARELALGAYMNGHIELQSMPIFVCEEADLIEEEEDV